MPKTIVTLAEEHGIGALGIAPAISDVTRRRAWARTVIVGAVCYLPPERSTPRDVPRASVAKVAQSSDYHVVLRAKLDLLAAAVRGAGGGAEVFVDTNPLPERELAVLAGVGWRGRNQQVFVDGCGSYAVLGEVLTDIDLPVSQARLSDHCGSCDLCIRACPTGALAAGDPSRCVSRLTQVSGVVPRELRSAMGDSIYGCDVCQVVCPHNAGVAASIPEFAQQVFPGPHPELIPLINLNPVDFRERIARSSIGWIRRTRIRRNAAIAAGNLRSGEAVPALILMLVDSNPVLRIHAAWALGKIRSTETLRALRSACAGETDAAVSEEIEAALANE